MKRFVLLAVAGTVSAASAQTMYTVRESDDVLERIDISDPNNPVFSDVGPLNTGFAFGGLTYDGGSGTMYMVAGRGNNGLYTVDLGSGNATAVGSHGINDIFAVAWDGTTDTLYATQFSGGSGLYTIDQGNGSATTINGSMNVGIGGLMYDASRDMLIGSQDGAGDLHDIDRSNGNQVLLFDGPFVNDSGLTHDTINDLYWGIDWSGVLFNYDPNNGFARTDVLTGLGSHDGLAYIPAPGSLALLGFAGLVATRRRRR